MEKSIYRYQNIKNVIKGLMSLIIIGFINLDDMVMSVNNVKIPKNKVYISFKDDKISANCDFKFLNNQFFKVKLNANHSKNRFVELYLNYPLNQMFSYFFFSSSHLGSEPSTQVITKSIFSISYIFFIYYLYILIV